MNSKLESISGLISQKKQMFERFADITSDIVGVISDKSFLRRNSEPTAVQSRSNDFSAGNPAMKKFSDDDELTRLLQKRQNLLDQLSGIDIELSDIICTLPDVDAVKVREAMTCIKPADDGFADIYTNSIDAKNSLVVAKKLDDDANSAILEHRRQVVSEMKGTKTKKAISNYKSYNPNNLGFFYDKKK